MSHTQSDDSPDDEEVYPFLIDSPDDRGQHDFCKNLLVNLFEPGIIPCKAEFPDVKIKRQIIEHYLKDICNLTQQYGIYTIELRHNLHHNHYEIDLLGTSTFKPIPYSQWIKNNTQQKRIKHHSYKKDFFPLIEKENLTDKINLSGPQTNDSKYTIN